MFQNADLETRQGLMCRLHMSESGLRGMRAILRVHYQVGRHLKLLGLDSARGWLGRIVCPGPKEETATPQKTTSPVA